MKPIIAILGLALLLNVGCAQEKSSGGAETPSGPVDDCGRDCPVSPGGLPGAPIGTGGGGAGGGGYYSGATAPLTNVQNLGALFFNSYPNNPQQIQVNIDMNRSRDSVIISYVDGTSIKEVAVGTQHPYTSHTNSSYNGWVTEGSSRVYKGFFQDEYGAVVVVIDRVLNTGDGTLAPLVGGSIWFQNFGDNPAYDNPYYKHWSEVTNRMCWQITYGPYDCRSFLTGNINGSNGGTVTMNSSHTPNNRGPTRTKSYQKLGDFDGLSRVNAHLPAQN